MLEGSAVFLTAKTRLVRNSAVKNRACRLFKRIFLGTITSYSFFDESILAYSDIFFLFKNPANAIVAATEFLHFF